VSGRGEGITINAPPVLLSRDGKSFAHDFREAELRKVADNPEFSENEFEDTAFFCDILA
jgi:hypothetical protein